MKVLHVVGARPNFMKTAPIMAVMGEFPKQFDQALVHTGQHYDQSLSQVFIDDLGLPCPDDFLNVGSGTHAEQTARVMLAFEPVLLRHRPDWVMVVGDVNSSLACALVAAKLGVQVAHVEAGLRSGDRGMPEEINRILIDQVADALFTPSAECEANLLREGVSPDKVHFVGNVMIDSLARVLSEALRRRTPERLELVPKEYILVTFHRPSNVDDPCALRELLAALNQIAVWAPVLFPVHPRTRLRMQSLEDLSLSHRVRLIEPLGYLDFVGLMHAARLVLTDSGGVQEETTYLGVPCLTARSTTERPVTIEVGTNRLVGCSGEQLVEATREVLFGSVKPAAIPDLWDGAAAKRIVATMLGWRASDAPSAVG